MRCFNQRRSMTTIKVTFTSCSLSIRLIRVQNPLNHIPFVFFFQSIKDNQRNFCQDLLTIENTDSDFFIQISYLCVSDFPSKNFYKLGRNNKKNNAWQKSNDAYSLSIKVRTDYAKLHFDLFFITILMLAAHKPINP